MLTTPVAIILMIRWFATSSNDPGGKFADGLNNTWSPCSCLSPCSGWLPSCIKYHVIIGVSAVAAVSAVASISAVAGILLLLTSFLFMVFLLFLVSLLLVTFPDMADIPSLPSMLWIALWCCWGQAVNDICVDPGKFAAVGVVYTVGAPWVLDLWISLRIFEKNRNDPTVIIMGLGEDDS